MRSPLTVALALATCCAAACSQAGSDDRSSAGTAGTAGAAGTTAPGTAGSGGAVGNGGGTVGGGGSAGNSGGSAGSAGSAGGSGGTAGVAVDPAESSGCGSTAMPPNGPQTIVVNGKTRDYIIRPPEPYDPNRPYAVVFVFHGFQQTGASMDNNSGPPYNFKSVLGATAIVLYPSALPNSGGDNSWARDIDDDLAFVDAMLATVESQLCADAGQVLAWGHSNGAVFANVVGCRRGNVVRGFAPVAGGLGTTTGCTPQTPAAFIVHGDLDMLVSIETGIKERDYWINASGCTPQNPTPVAPAPCMQYQGCRPGSPVVWCEHQETAYSGTGHGWPPWATAGMWNFFSGL